jgi:hypothetical protein
MATVKTSHTVSADKRVRNPLETLRAKIRFYVALEGLGVTLVYLSICFWAGLILDYGLFLLIGLDWIQAIQDLSGEGQTADTVVRGLLVGMFAGGLVIVVGAKVLLRLIREFSHSSLALILERRFPELLGDRLITAVELADLRQAENYGYSTTLVQKTIQEAAERVQKAPVAQVFNWNRLRRLWIWVLGLTVGLYVLFGSAYWGVNAILGESTSPLDYFWQFHHAASIWTERNVLLMNSYWPRNAYLELIRFQDTPQHPGEMRIGRDESRPDLQVRAYQYVLADTQSRGGWRPLRWQDLPAIIDPELLRRVKIPKDWAGWIVDLDDLDPNTPVGVIPSSWQGKKTGAIHREMSKPAMQKRLAAPAQRALDEFLDWRNWTFDKLQLQASKGEIRRLLRQQLPEAQKALEEVLARVDALAQETSMGRRLRKLAIPEDVEFSYWGKEYRSRRAPDRLPQDNNYFFGLAELKESVQFTVLAGNFATPVKSIKLVPPPTVISLSADKEEPAYIYYRLQGDQMPLKGKKQIFRKSPVSITGEISILQVPIGTNVFLYAQTDRMLKDGVRMTKPAQSEERGAVVPTQEVSVEEDRHSFSARFTNVVKTIEFNFEFNDLDNVRGKRRVVIRPVDDRAPEVFDVEIAAVLRKPKFKADPGKSTAGTPAEGFLITPDALLPFRGTLRDDYGLTKAEWAYEVEPVEIELMGRSGSQDRLPTLVLQGNTRLRRNALVVSGMPFLHGLPGQGIGFSIYWIWVNRMMQAEMALAAKKLSEDGVIPLERFQTRLEERANEELPLQELSQRLQQAPPKQNLFREHSLKEEIGFDLKKYLNRLKVQDPSRQAQLHYQLRLGVMATDNNVETGPSIGRNKSPFTFLVISENELLAQVFLEEEVLRERLDKAVFKLKDARTSIQEQLSRLSQLNSDLGLVAIRVDEVRKVLSDTGSATREIFGDYSRILRELEVNRVGWDRGKKKITDVQTKIVQPLEEIVSPNFGNFATCDEAVTNLYKGLDDDVGRLRQAEEEKKIVQMKAELAPRRPEHVKNAQFLRDQIDSLMERLNTVLLAMEEGIAFGQLLEIAVALERDQRQAAERLRLYEKELKMLLLKQLTQP